MSCALSQVGTGPDMTLDVPRTINNNKKTDNEAQCQWGPVSHLFLATVSS